MKAKLGHYVQWLREGFLQMLRLHPVEAGLIALGCIGCLVAYETDSDDTLVRLALVPLAFAVALAFNNLAGPGPWRKVYWVCWAPFVPFAFWGGLEEWLASEPSFITFGILAPLALLLCRRAVCNKRFVDDIMVWLRSGILAALFANVALGLFSAILFSTTYIFGLEGSWIEHVWIYALILFETFAGPVLFLMMYDRWAGAECRGTRILDVLLNYIVTPALLIYTAILCLYMVKILRYVVFARGRGGLSGVRVHTAGPRGQSVAAVVAETHVRLVLRLLQPGVVAYAAAVLDRRPASYERIRAYRTARIPACLRRADDALRAVVPLAPYRALPVRRPGGVRLLCGSGLPACARTAAHSDRLAGAPCRPCGKTA